MEFDQLTLYFPTNVGLPFLSYMPLNATKAEDILELAVTQLQLRPELDWSMVQSNYNSPPRFWSIRFWSVDTEVLTNLCEAIAVSGNITLAVR
jgi:hypothetical protein